MRRKGQHARRRSFSSLPEVHARTRRFHQITSEIQCHLETALPTEWRERSASPHTSSLGACPLPPAQTSLLTLAGGERRRSDILLAQLTRRMMSSIAIGTLPSVGVPLCSEFVLFFFLLTVPLPPRHCKESTFLFCSGAKFHFSVKHPCWAAQTQKPASSAPCTVASNTLHSNSTLTGAFQKITQHAPRVPSHVPGQPAAEVSHRRL